jgi:acetyl-CoA carboxylase, biotin carboxylase subunit
MKKVLIANRGEIAVRIIRACHMLNLKAVAVCSTADKDALHVRLADESYCIGGPSPRDSYLDQSAVLTAAKRSGADAVHPGFGMLSENAQFAAMLRDYGITWIGPKPEVITAMGDKAAARKTVAARNVAVVPGSDGPLTNEEEGLKLANEIGYPILLKAAAGGGGRGIRAVNDAREFSHAYRTASAEAKAAFSDGRLYLEKFIENPRHIEVQILADQHGRILHLGTRDCSIQRKKQKVVEEAPAASIPEQTSRDLCRMAVDAALAAGYENAGTVEFIVDKEGRPFFIEMNTRIQVEHTITEMVTGIDLVASQLRIAMGDRMLLDQSGVQINGHAIECRVNAEVPSKGFAPSPGTISTLVLPGGPGVRVDTAMYQGCVIPPYYDAMILKLVSHGESRYAAIQRMKQALSELKIEGVGTNINFLRHIVNRKEFADMACHTSWVEKEVLPGYAEEPYAVPV